MTPAPRQRLLPLITRGGKTGTASGLREQTAEEGSRTPTPLRAEDFESSASASSATSAPRPSVAASRAARQHGGGWLTHERMLVNGNPFPHRLRRDDADILVNLNARVPHFWRFVRLQCLREYLHARQARRARRLLAHGRAARAPAVDRQRRRHHRGCG